MGGREAIRGFAIQTLICLLDAIDDPEWTSVTIEPDSGNEKVDILWTYPDRRRAVQVKSSRNTVGRSDIKAWCNELAASGSADEYELRLAGPTGVGALAGGFGNVAVPLPNSLLLSDLRDQAVTRIDRYLARQGIASIPVEIRTNLVSVCASRLTEGSAYGTSLTRNTFDGWILHWIAASYPDAIKARLASDCEVLSSLLRIVSPPPGTRAFDIELPLTFINWGRGAAIVEWAIILIDSPDCRRIYGSTSTCIGANRVPYVEFAIGPGQVVERTLCFKPFARPGFSTDAWDVGEHRFILHINFSSETSARSVKTSVVSITTDHMGLLSQRGAADIAMSTMERYIREM